MLKYLIGYLMLPNKLNLNSRIQLSPFKLHIDITTQEDYTLHYIIYFLILLNISAVTYIIYITFDKKERNQNGEKQ